ncbi:hypothetical protein EDB89DRAFT_2157606 [Lactarius sanguifluus]|nr:hypothetical protein EDB89DRAFT_2157606 [Lactarius sanguifluus]
MRMYYDDDDDDDPYALHIGPAVMPSPHLKFAPYYSGHADSFEDFLEEYEGLVYDFLWPRLLGKNPFQLPDVPFHFEDVFGCTRAAFAYDNYFPSPWSHAKQFEPLSLRLTRNVATYTETTSDKLSLSIHPMPSTQLPPSSSPSALEPRHMLAHSVTLDQPEPTPTLPTMLRPSASFSTPSHASSLACSAADNDPIFVSTPPSTLVSSMFLPLASPTLSRSHSHSLAHATADIHEISSTPLSSPTLAPFSMPISSNVEYLSLVTVDQPAPHIAPFHSYTAHPLADEYILTNAHDNPPSPTTCPPTTPLEDRQVCRYYPSTSIYDLSKLTHINCWVDPPLVLKNLVNLFEFGETWDHDTFNDFQGNLSAIVDACNNQLLFWHLSDITTEQLVLWTKNDYLWFNHIPPNATTLSSNSKQGIRSDTLTDSIFLMKKSRSPSAKSR